MYTKILFYNCHLWSYGTKWYYGSSTVKIDLSYSKRGFEVLGSNFKKDGLRKCIFLLLHKSKDILIKEYRLYSKKCCLVFYMLIILELKNDEVC